MDWQTYDQRSREKLHSFPTASAGPEVAHMYVMFYVGFYPLMDHHAQCSSSIASKEVNTDGGLGETTFEPRIIEIEHQGYRMHERPKLPIALKVCSESRAFVQLKYPICFDSQCRVNFELDTIFHDPWVGSHDWSLPPCFDKFEMSNIRHLAIQYGTWLSGDRLRNHSAKMESYLAFMPHLQELIVVYNVSDLTRDEHPFFDPEIANRAPIQLYADFAPRNYRGRRAWPRILSRLPDVMKTHPQWTACTKAKVYAMYGYRECTRAWDRQPPRRAYFSMVAD